MPVSDGTRNLKASGGLTGVQRRVRTSSMPLLMLAASFVLAACGPSGRAGPAPPPPVVSVGQVIEREITEWDDYTGRLEAVRTVELRPRVGGYVEKVNFREGAIVRKGDVLFIIDPRPFQAEFDRAEAELQRAVDRTNLAKAEAVRARKLLDARAISEEEYDQRTTARAEGESSQRAAAAEVAIARLNLEWTSVTAPIDGRVSRALVTEGNLVSGGSVGATVLTTIVSISPVYAYFEADEHSYLKYERLAREGTRASSREVRNPVRMGLANEPGHPHEGYIDFVDNRVDPKTGTIRGRAVFENRDGALTPGLFARIRLLGSVKRAAVLINDRAVGTDQGQKFVFLVNANNVVEYRVVKLGPVIDGMRVVREGLRQGERIVVNGIQRVRSGIPVAPEPVSMETLKPEGGGANVPAKAPPKSVGRAPAAPASRAAS